MTQNPNYLVAEVRVNVRDGCFHAYSTEILGLHICGQDRNDVLVDVKAAIRHLFKVNRGEDVTVEWAADPSAIDPRVVHERVVERFVMQRTFAVAA